MGDASGVEFTAEQLDTFVGAYALSEYFKIVISRRSARLFGQPTGQDEAQLKPLSDNRFRVFGLEIDVEFTRDSNGNIESLTFHQDGEHQTALKVSD